MKDSLRTSATRSASQDSGGDESHARSMTIGLLAPPQMPNAVVGTLADELPEALSGRASVRVAWQVEIVRDSRVPDVEGGNETIDDLSEWRRSRDWDLAVCLTDLPTLSDKRPVVAEVSSDRDAVLVSLPALGATRRIRRGREAIVFLADELLADDALVERRDGPRHDGHARRLAPVGELTRSPDGDRLQLLAPKRSGSLRLLAGMVRANRPFRVVLDLSYALAAALGIAAFTLVTESVWKMSAALGAVRLSVPMIISVVAMVVWLTVVHGLWHRPSQTRHARRAKLFNATTLITPAHRSRHAVRGAVRADPRRRRAVDRRQRAQGVDRPVSVVLRLPGPRVVPELPGDAERHARLGPREQRRRPRRVLQIPPRATRIG